MTQLEKEIEAKLRSRVQAADGLCLKWVCPGWAGVPDRIVLLPGARIVFVELKRPKGGQLSPLQIWWGNTLTRLGFDHRVIWNYQDVADFCDQYLNEKEKHHESD